MYQLILFLHVIICVAIIVLVLIQHGKGAEIGANFGSGASNTIFGSQGSGSFLMKTTGFLAAAFFAACLILGGLATYSYKHAKVLNISEIAQPEKGSVPDTKTKTNSSTDKE